MAQCVAQYIAPYATYAGSSCNNLGSHKNQFPAQTCITVRQNHPLYRTIFAQSGYYDLPGSQLCLV
jgi:hypothetical protein